MSDFPSKIGGRLKAILGELIQRQAEKAEASHDDEKHLRKAIREVEQKIDRMMDAIASGMVGSTEGFKRKLSDLERQREELLRQASARKRRREMPSLALTDETLEQFARAARAKLRDGDPAFRKNYLRLFVERIEVNDDQIQISGTNAALAAMAQMKKPGTNPVPSFVRNWWAQ